jgi:hypothetical protein
MLAKLKRSANRAKTHIVGLNKLKSAGGSGIKKIRKKLLAVSMLKNALANRNKKREFTKQEMFNLNPKTLPIFKMK